MPVKIEVEELFPSIIIGLGGTGKKVLTGIRAYLERRMGEVPTKRIRLLSLDIDPQEEIARADSKEVTLKDNEKINLGGVPLEEIRRLVEKGKYPALEPWFDKDVVNVERVLVQAAHQIRQAGRIAFFWHLSSSITTSRNVAKIIKDNIDALIDIYHGDVTKPPRINVFIISSLCGGTGSGMFIDTAYVVQRLLSSNRDYATIIGILFFPGFYKSASPEPLRANTWASMTELNYFMTTDADERKFKEIEYLPGEEYIRRVPCVNKPFDQVYLIDNQLEGGRKIIGIDAGVKAVVEAVGLLVTSRISDDVHSRIADIPALRNYQDGTVFSSLAVSSLVLPMFEIHQWVSNRLLKDQLEEILYQTLDPTLTPDPEVEKITGTIKYDQINMRFVTGEGGKSLIPVLSEHREFKPGTIENIPREAFTSTITTYLSRFKRKYDPGFRELLDEKIDKEFQNFRNLLDSFTDEILTDERKGLKYLQMFYNQLKGDLEKMVLEVEDKRSELANELRKQEGALQAAENKLKESLQKSGFSRIFGGDKFVGQRNHYMSVLGKLVEIEYRIMIAEAIQKTYGEFQSYLDEKIGNLGNFVNKLRYIVEEKIPRNMEEAVDDILSLDPVRERPIIIGPPGKEREGLIENLEKIYREYHKDSLEKFKKLFNNPEDPVLSRVITMDDVEEIENTFLDISRVATEVVKEMELEDWIRKEKNKAYEYLKETFEYASYMFRTKTAEIRATGVFSQEVVILGLKDTKNSVYTNEFKDEAQMLIDKEGVSLVDTSDPYSIVVLRMGHGLRMEDFTEKAQYIGDYKKYMDRMQPVHVFPEFNINYKSRGLIARQLITAAMAFDIITEKLGAFYLVSSSEENSVLITRKGIFELFWTVVHDENLMKTIANEIQKFMFENDEDAMILKLKSLKERLQPKMEEDSDNGWLYEIVGDVSEHIAVNPQILNVALEKTLK